MRVGKDIVRCGLSGLLAVALCSTASALPFNDDMVDVQLKTGQVVRPAVKGTVPLGSLQYASNKMEAMELTNPVEASKTSVATGKRLYAINCLPCHGDISEQPVERGAVGKKFITPPIILTDKPYYPPEEGGITNDAKIYATVRYGGAIMPKLGHKLSAVETWDIVNYIRNIQHGAK